VNRASIGIVIVTFSICESIVALEKSTNRLNQMIDEIPCAMDLLNRVKPLQPQEQGHQSECSQVSAHTLSNSIGMKLAKIPSGEFMMGSENGDHDETPVHRVVISQDFWMGIHEVTQAQYIAVMGMNPSKFKGDDLPVETVSWNKARDFCLKLSQAEDRLYRLPTEAEWEYACRAGSTTAYCFGDDNSALGSYAWHNGNYSGRTHSVGQKLSNIFGLFDMHGNVLEWCRDRYAETYYVASPLVDPNGPDASSRRVVARGGCYRDNPSSCRSAYRGVGMPRHMHFSCGFRVVLVASPKVPPEQVRRSD